MEWFVKQNPDHTQKSTHVDPFWDILRSEFIASTRSFRPGFPVFGMGQTMKLHGNGGINIHSRARMSAIYTLGYFGYHHVPSRCHFFRKHRDPRKLGPRAATQAGYMILALIQLYRSSRPGLLTWVDREIRRETNDLKIRWAVAKGFWDGEIWWNMVNVQWVHHPFSWWNPSNRSIWRDFSVEVSELHHYCKLSIVSYVHDNIDTFISSIRLRGLRAISFDDGPWCQIWQISFVSVASHLTGAAQHYHFFKRRWRWQVIPTSTGSHDGTLIHIGISIGIYMYHIV
jgi:hypothetical protein